MTKAKEPPFGTAQSCPLGLDLWGNYPDGSVYMLSLTWEEVARFAKEHGKLAVGKGGSQKVVDRLSEVMPLKKLRRS